MERDDQQEDEAMERRRANVAAAVASAWIEGTSLSPETASLFEAYVRGRIGADDVVAITLTRYGRTRTAGTSASSDAR